MGRDIAVIAMCTKDAKCQWRTVELLDDYMLAHQLATAHTMTAHPGDYLLITGRDSVPVLSLLAEIQLSFYTDFSWESIL